jgi:hypothetical protein
MTGDGDFLFFNIQTGCEAQPGHEADHSTPPRQMPQKYILNRGETSTQDFHSLPVVVFLNSLWHVSTSPKEFLLADFIIFDNY